jgi:chromosome segregation ATPase
MSPERTTQDAGANARAYGIDDVRALVDALQNQIDQLGRQLDDANEANRENRRIIAALTQRIPEIEPPRDSTPEPRDAPENAAEPRPGTEAPTSGTTEPRASWWRRFFGFE